ncbi:MAG: hypothetical protein KAR22_02870 [Gammaproteobacteria bacterium]|nr:hypothetical protein [Gammaproteobacteria bacterium]
MKNTLFLLAVLLLVGDVAAQDHIYNFVGIRIGQTIAQGDYAETVFDQNTENAGFAENGFAFNIEGGRFFNENFGVGASLSASFNGLDDGALVEEALRALPALTSLEVDGGSYKNISFLVGPYARLPITKSISLLGMAKIGVMTSTRPDSDISWQRQGELPRSVDIDGSWGTAFAFSISAAIKTRIKGGPIEIGPQVEYVSAKPEYGFYSYDPFFGWSYIEGKSQQVDLLNFGFGLTYSIR